MDNKIDLNKIRDEIANEKQSKYANQSQLGESAGVGVAPRDTFLHGLQQSLLTGQETPSTNLIKVVENATVEKHGGVPTHRVNEAAPAPAPTNIPTKVSMSPERDEKLFADLENKRKATLAESIAGFQGTPANTPQAPVVNFNGQQLLTSVPQGATVPQTGGQINENALIESVQHIVNSHLQNNLSNVFDEAIKSTIIEMYAVERVKEVLNENRDLIREVVIETFKDIQARNKAKKEQQ